jgi:aspartate/methionine/tyrosine aminotransferase
MSTRPAANALVIDTGSPPIPEARAWLEIYDGQLGSPLNLSQAAPGTPPPIGMLERLAQAAADPAMASYGRILGDMALVDIYAAHLRDLYKASVSADEIAITAGCNLAFVAAVMAVAKSGDTILLPEPWYFNHHMTLQMLGLRALPLPCRAENGFVPDVEEARALIARQAVRAIVLVTPNNPTGAIYPAATLEAFGRLAVEHQAWLLLDETYRDFMPEAEIVPHTLLSEPDLAGSTIQLYSFSKSYALPGYRLGALRAPLAVMPEITKVLDCLQICAPRIGQTALTWAIPSLGAWREANRADIAARAVAFQAAMFANPGWIVRSLGAYFAYVEHPLVGQSAVAVAQRLAREMGVLTLPGSFFGNASQDRYLRFAFANVDVNEIAGLSARLQRMAPTPISTMPVAAGCA